MEPITLETLARAIMVSEDGFDMSFEDAREMGLHILNFFGYSGRIIDNVLEPQDRDLFYMMEDRELLVTEREETTLYDGREWRIHYWIMCTDRILSLAKEGKQRYIPTEDDEILALYDEMPEELWQRS